MSAALPARQTMTIGEVLGQLRPDFPDVTISKIRFLEAEGLVEPERAPSGYRRFTHDDVARLRYVLTAQRERYLPLRVIKDQLDAIDRGLPPPTLPGRPGVPRAVLDGEGPHGGSGPRHDSADVRLSRQELLQTAGIDGALLEQLEAYALVVPRGSGHYNGDALIITKVARDLARHGLEPRHLRQLRTAADREIGLVEQVVSPLLRQRGAEARGRAEERAREIASLVVRLHTALVDAGLRRLGGR